MLDLAEQVDQRAPDAIYRPGHDYVELAVLRLLEHVVEAWAILAALGRAT